jgi:hypothetical protein
VHSLWADVSKTLVHAFVSSRLIIAIHCRMGRCWRFAAEVAVDPECSRRERMRSHYASVTWTKRWLPAVRQQIKFKIACLVFQLLSGQAPDCLIDDYRLVIGSLHHATCYKYHEHNRFIDRSFSASGPYLYPQPNDLQLVDVGYKHCKQQMQHCMFRSHGALLIFLYVRLKCFYVQMHAYGTHIYIFIYLFTVGRS